MNLKELLRVVGAYLETKEPMEPITYTGPDVGWYAVIATPQREDAVVNMLARYGVYSFIPVETRVSSRQPARGTAKRRTRQVPILPGYVFSKFRGAPRWHIIKDLPNISGVLGHLGRPVCLTYSDLRNLHSMRKRNDQMRARASMPKRLAFKAGEVVRVSELTALEGFVREITDVDDAREVATLADLSILGRPVQVPFANLVKL